jgi:hypothetical protein
MTVASGVIRVLNESDDDDKVINSLVIVSNGCVCG